MPKIGDDGRYVSMTPVQALTIIKNGWNRGERNLAVLAARNTLFEYGEEALPEIVEFLRGEAQEELHFYVYSRFFLPAAFASLQPRYGSALSPKGTTLVLRPGDAKNFFDHLVGPSTPEVPAESPRVVLGVARN